MALAIRHHQALTIEKFMLSYCTKGRVRPHFIKCTTQTFQAKEPKLHILFNNAGVSLPPTGSKSAENHELQLATNYLGPWLLDKLLLPQLRAAAEFSPPAIVHGIWTSLLMVELTTPKYGTRITALLSEAETAKSDKENCYIGSNTGNWFLASEFGRIANNRSKVDKDVGDDGKESGDIATAEKVWTW